jgi:predicted transcriptional regulator
MNEPETEQLRREIERTRAELGATVEALSQKTDVKAQARARAEQAKVQAREKAELAKSQAQEKPAIQLAAGIVVAIAALLLIRQRRRS